MKTIEKNCLNCNKKFNAPIREINRGNGKFCSLKCSSQYVHKNRAKPEPNCTCALCGKEFYKYASKLRSKSGLYFCCRAHKDKAQRLGGIEEIMPPHYGTGNGEYRKIAFEHYPEQCNRCGFKEHPEILQVHHKDRDTKNNKPENLEVLCPNCHNWEHYTTCSGLYNNLAQEN